LPRGWDIRLAPGRWFLVGSLPGADSFGYGKGFARQVFQMMARTSRFQ